MSKDEEAMAARLVAAAQKGFPDDAAMQLRQLSAHALQMPLGFTGVFLRAMAMLTERSVQLP